MRKPTIIITVVILMLLMAIFVGCSGNGDNGNGGDGYMPNSSPVATAGNDYPVQIGEIVSFSGTGTDNNGSISKYEWDFNGDGTYDWNSGTTGSTTHVYGAVGTYTAILRVTDNKGATDTDTCVISVYLRTLDISGTWSGNWFRSDGGEEGTMIAVITQSGSSLSGDMTIKSTTFSDSNETTIDGIVQGNDMVFDIAISTFFATLVIHYQGTVSEDADQMIGTYSMSTGYTGIWDAMRQ